MLRTANQIRASQSFTFSFSAPSPHPVTPHPPASNSAKFTTAAAHASHNNALYCCAELSSQAFVFFDPCDRWGTHFFFCRGSHRRLLLDGPAPGWWPFVHHGVTHTEDKHELELSPSLFLFFPSPCVPAHSSVLIWSSFPSCASIGADLRQAGDWTPLWKQRKMYTDGIAPFSLWNEVEFSSQRVRPSTWSSQCVWVCEHADDQERDGGPELIVQTQFLRLPLWNQELWMDITPLTSENQQGTQHHGWDNTRRHCGWTSERHWKTNRERETEGDIE